MIERDKELAGMTTFGIPARAKYYADYSDVKQLTRLSRSEEFLNNEVLNIGGGSNLLFINDFDGLVLHSSIKGIKVYRKNAETTYVIAGAGENWADFVEWCVENDFAGLENLAGIPGDVGASAVQNVGAYGVEAKDYIFSVECFDTETRQTVKFMNHECGYGYRDSLFKKEWKGRYIVLRVSYALREHGQPRHLDYGPLQSLEERLGRVPTLHEVADEVKRIRDGKLPDPKVLGSAGSFFKNPVISEYFYNEEIKPFYPEMPVYSAGEKMVKLSAAWMIDHAGLKGRKVGGAAVYERQPLVIVNCDGASGRDVAQLARMVESEVKRKFKVELHPEVNYIDTSVTVTVLGSGTSKGIPEIGCGCEVCTSDDPHDKRLRSSVLVQTHGMNIVIDPGPDFREQALSNGISSIDAVLVTHSHYDHVGGIDDLRPFCVYGPVKLYVREDVDHDLRKRLDYCFREHLYPGVPSFDMRIIDDRPFEINGLKIVPINVWHGRLPIFGYRIGDFAYITDAKKIDEEELDKLEGVKVMIVNALRYKPHFAHFSVEEALEFIENVKPERAYLTHFCHDIGRHEELMKKLPKNVFPVYDGEILKVE